MLLLRLKERHVFYVGDRCYKVAALVDGGCIIETPNHNMVKVGGDWTELEPSVLVSNQPRDKKGWKTPEGFVRLGFNAPRHIKINRKNYRGRNR